MNCALKSFYFRPCLLVLVLWLRQFVFEVLNAAVHVPLARRYLSFIPDLVLSNLSFALGFCLVAHPHELFFFQSDALSFKFKNLEFLFVLATELHKLRLPILIQLALILKLLVDWHKLFQISLHSLLVLLILAVHRSKLEILICNLLILSSQVFFTFNQLLETATKLINRITILRVESFSNFLVKSVFVLEQGELLPHFQ